MDLLKWIRVGNDCAKCKYCWEQRTSYEYDEYDCGCHIKGMDYDEKACHLVEPFKTILGEMAKKKFEYYEARQWDGIGDFFEKEEREISKLAELIQEKIIGDGGLYWRDLDGNYHEYNPVCNRENVWRVRDEYEDFAHPFVYKKLSTEWKELIVKTAKVVFNKTLGRLKPYVCK